MGMCCNFEKQQETDLVESTGRPYQATTSGYLNETKIGGCVIRAPIYISTTPSRFLDLNKSRQRKRLTGGAEPTPKMPRDNRVRGGRFNGDELQGHN